MAKSSASLLPAGYGKFLEDIKQRVRAAQVRATLSANRELITLYWDIGKGIIERQRAEGWGKAVVERLAKGNSLVLILPVSRRDINLNYYTWQLEPLPYQQ
jgi:hypothetical protein